MGVQKDRKEALVLIPYQIPTKHTECVHTRKLFVLSLIVNTATGSQSHGQALGLKSLMQSFLVLCSECSKSFESKRFTMTVAQVVNHGERFNDCGCVIEWEWVSVNITRIGLVGRRREKLVGHSELHLFVCLLHHYYSYLFCFSIWWKILYRRRLSLEMEEKICEEMKPGTDQCAVLWFCSFRSWFHRLQDLTFTFQFRYDKRGVCTGVRWSLGCW